MSRRIRIGVPLAAGLLVLLTVSQMTLGSNAREELQPLPFAEPGYVLGDDIAAYNSFMMSGGPPPDGIPSIDSPRWVSAADARLDPGDKIIGFVHNGDARAYPQNIMVYHEIVNDRVGDLNIAITYCPLTATAQGFERGSTTLGVSGQLLNSNLVMFDRESRSFFSRSTPPGSGASTWGRRSWR